ncbi:MAG: hypothetical protein KF863_10420 [Rubrivivax sp.]|nr:hypothetical protein [Rubrivivax sp.]
MSELKGRRSSIARALGNELGATIKTDYNGSHLALYFVECPLQEVLDAVTVVFHLLEFDPKHFREQRQRTPICLEWHKFVARCMTEENVGYRIDEDGGVHPVVDQEFDRNQAAAVAALQHPHLANALHSHEAAYRHFEAQHQDRKAAVRSIFETVEILAKLLCPAAPRLNHALIVGDLRAVCLPLMAQDPTEQRVLGSMFDSLDQWTTGLHNYRHGQGQPDPVAPSEQLTVWALSTGSAFARVLAECYAARAQA